MKFGIQADLREKNQLILVSHFYPLYNQNYGFLKISYKSKIFKVFPIFKMS